MKYIAKKITEGTEITFKIAPESSEEISRAISDYPDVCRIVFMSPVVRTGDIEALGIAGCLKRLHFNLNPTGLDCSSLAQVVGLEEITGGDLCWFDCAVLPDLRSLKTFRMGGNVLNINKLIGCAGLKWLEFRGVEASDCSFVTGLRELERMRLWDCFIPNVCGIEGCSSLAIVDLGRSNFVDISNLEALSFLKKLGLERCPKSLKVPESFSELEFLDASYCKITNLAKLILSSPRLRKLVLVGVHLSEGDISAIASHPSLAEVSVLKEYCKPLKVGKRITKVIGY